MCVCDYVCVCVSGRNIHIMHKHAVSQYCYMAVPTKVPLIGVSLNM